MLKSLLVVVLLGLSQLSGRAQPTCSSSFSVDKNGVDNSLTINIEPNGSYECKLFVVERGEFHEVKSIRDHVSKQRFEGLEKGKVYMIKLEFANEIGLCKSRALGGIKL